MTSAVTQPRPASTASAVATAVKVRWSAAASAAQSRHAAMGNAARTGRYARQHRLEQRVSQQTVAVAAIRIASLAKSATAVSAVRADGSAPMDRGAMFAATPVRAVNSRTTSAAQSTSPASRTKGVGSGGSQPCGGWRRTLSSCRSPRSRPALDPAQAPVPRRGRRRSRPRPAPPVRSSHSA